MKIIIVGNGKVGYAIASQLAGEHHDIVMVDDNAVALQRAENALDVMCIEGNGASIRVLKEAGAQSADLVIAVTNLDDTNLLCCFIAKKLGAGHTIARVRSPMYVEELNLIKDDLGLSMAINPEEACATEMARVLRFPSAIKIDTFARGHVEILKTGVAAGSPLDGMVLKDIGKFRANVLICAVERGERDVIIPSGEFQLKAGDRISVVASPQELVSMIVAKAVNMAEMMKVPMLGIVENMSYIVCPDCGKHINVFGDSHVDEVAAKHHLPVLAKCPIDPQLAALSDAGMIETYGGQFLEGAADACEKLLK